MRKKFIIFVVLCLFLATSVSYAFAQCSTDKQNKEQKVACYQCCCGKCSK